MAMRTKTAVLATGLILIAAGNARALVNAGTGWVEAWGQGAAFSICIAGGKCVETVKGTGAARTFFGSGPIGPYTFEASWTLYSPPTTASSTTGACPRIEGSFSIRTPASYPGTLILDIEGQDCPVAAGSATTALTAAYVVDGAHSTGRYAGASGVGTFTSSEEPSVAQPNTIISFSGNLHFFPLPP
jgi:hypothetical protein